MANLQENEVWVEGIYQLETTDPVMGGPDGIDNVQAKQLGSRTKYLKKGKMRSNRASMVWSRQLTSR